MEAFIAVVAVLVPVLSAVGAFILAWRKIRNDLRAQLLDDLQEERTKAQEGHAGCLKTLTDLLEGRIATLETLSKTIPPATTTASEKEGE